MLNHDTGPMNQKTVSAHLLLSPLLPGHRYVATAALLILVFSVHIRFDILDQEMKTLIAQIDGVNVAANSLVESNHPRSAEVKQYQDHLNTRWAVGRARSWGLLFPASDTPTPQIRMPAVFCHVCALSAPASLSPALLPS